jgi:hypothetical protein
MDHQLCSLKYAHYLIEIKLGITIMLNVVMLNLEGATVFNRSQGSSVSIVSDYGLDYQGVIPNRGR